MRIAPRLSLRLPVILSYTGQVGGLPLQELQCFCVSTNVSSTGVGLKILSYADFPAMGQRVVLELLPRSIDSDVRIVMAAKIIWRDKRSAGVRIEAMERSDAPAFEALLKPKAA